MIKEERGDHAHIPPGSSTTQGREENRTPSRSIRSRHMPLTARGEATRRRVLDAAEAVFGELGYYGASVAEITRRAGVAQGTFYIYFHSKREIFAVLVEDLGKRLRATTRKAIEAIPNRLEVEQRGKAAFFEFASTHRRIYRIVQEAERVAPEAAQAYYLGISRGYARPAGRDGSQNGPVDGPGSAGLRAHGHRPLRRAALDHLASRRRRNTRKAATSARGNIYLGTRIHHTWIGTLPGQVIFPKKPLLLFPHAALFLPGRHMPAVVVPHVITSPVFCLPSCLLLVFTKKRVESTD